MRLLKLTLKNFKGIRDFTLDVQGSVVSILADNGCGKTTLFDAFTWLLFNKDSSDRADFEVKTLDCNNNPIHHLEHEVIAIVELGGKKVELRKVYKEKWTKKRGQIETEFTGHKTEYFVDEVPRDKKDYDEFINSIVPEKIFKLVTNPLYFNSVLHWKERREIALSMCGDVTNEEVFEVNGDIGFIKELLDDKTVDDALKMLNSKKKKINDELEEIPTRISEVTKMLPELPQDFNSEALAIKKVNVVAEIIALESQIGEVQKNIEADKSSIYEVINEKQKKLLELRNQTFEQEMKAKHQEQMKLAALDLAESKKTRIIGMRKSIKQFEESLIVLNDRVNDLRKTYLDIEKQTFEMTDGDCNCKHCGQTLPEKLKGEKLGMLKAKFEFDKNKELDGIVAKGNSTKLEIESYQKSVANHLEEIKKLQSESENIELSTNEVMNLSTDLSTEIEDLSTEIAQLKAQVESINYEDCTKEIKSKIEVLRTELEEINTGLALKSVYDNSQKRIQELELQEKHLSSVFVQLEKQIFGVEQFIMTRVSLLEGKLNSMFDGVRFKLFQQNINGGIQEAFEVLIDGVPYSDANGAAKINSGIEIINQLCRFYAITAPIWVDNAESVVSLEKADSQMIRLVVSEGDKQLRVVGDSELRQTA